MTDGELVRRARDGHAPAFEQLALRWTARVLAVCHARVAQRDIAEDLAQDSLLRAFERLDSLRSPEQFGPWLRGIAVNLCLDWRRAHARRDVRLSELGQSGRGADFPARQRDVEADVQLRDDADHLQAQIHALPEELREVLLLRYYDDMTYDQLAAVLGVSRATVNSRLAQARDILKRRLAPAVS